MLNIILIIIGIVFIGNIVNGLTCNSVLKDLNNKEVDE